MDYVMPSEVANVFVSVGAAKAQLKIRDYLLRGFLSGAAWLCYHRCLQRECSRIASGRGRAAFSNRLRHDRHSGS